MGTIRSIITAPRAAASRARALPVAPSKLADRAIRRLHARRERLAAQDQTWAEIEARRHRDGGVGTLFLSEEAGLGFAEWEEQQRIERELIPDPWWLPLAYRARDWTARRAVRSMRFAGQRRKRGWSDLDAAGAGRHIARANAEMLEHLASSSHGWPNSDEFATHEAWVAALRHNAAQLRRWVEGRGETELRSRWYAAEVDRNAPDGEADRLSSELRALEAENLDAARDALRWIAEHVDLLWD